MEVSEPCMQELKPITDFDAYRRRLEKLLGRARGIMHGLYDRAKSNPKRIVFPEGEQEKIIRAAKILIEEGLAEPILLVKEEIAAPLLERGAQALFHKGQDVEAELTEAAKYWKIEADLVASRTNPAGRIVVVRGLLRANAPGT